MPQRFSWKERFASFKYAWAGIRQAMATDHNMWIHLTLTVLALLLAVLCRISRGEWMALTIVIAMVWLSELFNTAIEKTMDFITTERLPQIKFIKDIAAAAVLIASLAAVIVGCLIFIPYVVR